MSMRNALSGVLIFLAVGALSSHQLDGPRPAAPAAVRREASRPEAGASIGPVPSNPTFPLKGSFNGGRVGHYHHAIDILAPRGTPVLAAVDGTVRKLFLSRAGGITIYEFDRAS